MTTREAGLTLSADRRDPQTFAIIGSAIEVHRELGSGFLEPVYQEALAIELRRRNVPFEREVSLAITYKDEPLRCVYRADFVCYGEVILELKALAAITTSDQAQLLNYLKATGLRRGLIINFGGQRIESKRMVL
jgi:GxxExxY protein